MKHTFRVNILFGLMLLCSLAYSQGGYLKPAYVGWPPAAYDTTDCWELGLNPVTLKGYWKNVCVGNDSVQFSIDSVCYFLMGDEFCVELDSMFYTDTSVCFIDMLDTTCLDWNNGGLNWYNSNGTFTSNRIATVQSPRTVEITESGVPFFRLHTVGDSTVFHKQIKIKGALRDASGDPGSANQILTSTISGVDWKNLSAIYSPLLNEIGAANGSNQIDNVNNTQWWEWNSLGAETGMKFSSTSTSASADLQKVVEINLSGANSGAGQITYGLFSSNTHTGTTSDNYALYGIASGGTNNYGLGVSGKLHIEQTASLPNVFINCGPSAPTGVDNIGITTTLTASGAFDALTSGINNIAIGSSVIAGNLAGGSNNILMGQSAGFSLTSGFGNIMIGTGTGQGNNTGDSCVIIGQSAGSFGVLTHHDRNTFIGAAAGNLSNGDGHVFLGHAAGTSATGNNKLYIDNTSTSSPLIYGEFDNNIVKINGNFQTVQGADVASAAGNITLGTDGNVFEITGTEAITRINTSGQWVNGNTITLLFTSTASLVDGTANSGANIGFELAGNTDFTGAAGSTITLCLSEIGGTQRWRQIGGSVN